MKKLLISLIALSSIPALTMGSTIQQRRAAMLAAQQAAAGQQPNAPIGIQPTVAAPGNNQGLNAVVAQIQQVLKNASNTVFTTRLQNLKTLISTLTSQQAPLVPLSSDEKNKVLMSLNAVWKEANDLIALCPTSTSAFIPYLGTENATIQELKDIKFEIAEIAKTLTGSTFQLSYTIPAYVDSYWKKTATIAALTLWATYRLGLGSKASDVAPKALSMGWDLAKWIAVGNSAKAAPVNVPAPAAKGWFANLVEAAQARTK